MKELLFLGDSITDAGHLFDNKNGGLGVGFVALIGKVLDGTAWKIINKGQDGFTSGDVLKHLARNWPETEPDIVTLLVGVNDIPVHIYNEGNHVPVQYEENIRGIIRKIKERCKAQICIIEPFLFAWPQEYRSWFQVLKKEQEVLQRLCEEEHLRYLPIHERLLEEASRLKTDELSMDGIHLTEKGNQILAEQWLSVFIRK